MWYYYILEYIYYIISWMNYELHNILHINITESLIILLLIYSHIWLSIIKIFVFDLHRYDNWQNANWVLI